MEKRFIKISKEEELELRSCKKNSKSERNRDRAHAILLSSNQHSIAELATIFEVRRATIAEWFDRWEESGLGGLADGKKSGRPPIFTKKEQKK